MRETRPEWKRRYQALIAGLRKHRSELGTLKVASVDYSPDEIIDELMSVVDASNATDAARAAWLQSVLDERTLHAKVHPLELGLTELVRVRHAGAVDQLADYGLAPRARRPKSPGTKVAAAEKARATRKARHTMGKRQRAKIKGTP